MITFASGSKGCMLDTKTNQTDSEMLLQVKTGIVVVAGGALLVSGLKGYSSLIYRDPRRLSSDAP